MRLPKSHILFPSADSQGHLLVSWQPGPTKIAQDAAKGVSKIAPWVVVCFTNQNEPICRILHEGQQIDCILTPTLMNFLASHALTTRATTFRCFFFGDAKENGRGTDGNCIS